jgi:hypothetical protein
LDFTKTFKHGKRKEATENNRPTGGNRKDTSTRPLEERRNSRANILVIPITANSCNTNYSKLRNRWRRDSRSSTATTNISSTILLPHSHTYSQLDEETKMEQGRMPNSRVYWRVEDAAPWDKDHISYYSRISIQN